MTSSCLIGTKGAPSVITTLSTSAKTRSPSGRPPSSSGTSISTSPTGVAGRPWSDEALEQAIPIWDPSCGHMHGFGHETSLPWIQDGANPALG